MASRVLQVAYLDSVNKLVGEEDCGSEFAIESATRARAVESKIAHALRKIIDYGGVARVKAETGLRLKHW